KRWCDESGAGTVSDGIDLGCSRATLSPAQGLDKSAGRDYDAASTASTPRHHLALLGACAGKWSDHRPPVEEPWGGWRRGPPGADLRRPRRIQPGAAPCALALWRPPQSLALSHAPGGQCSTADRGHLSALGLARYGPWSYPRPLDYGPTSGRLG